MEEHFRRDDIATLEKWCYRVMLQILRALAFMHAGPRIAHKDLKPDNVLFAGNRHGSSDSLKIIDFGLAEAFGNYEYGNFACGTPLFSAPEMLEGKLYDFK